MRQFGPNPPQGFDESMERLQQQLGQIQSMLESMSPEMRQEVEDALSAASDPETRREKAECSTPSWSSLCPMDDLRRQYPFLGNDRLTMEQAMEVMRTGKLDKVDPEQLARLLGDEARRTWEQLDRLRQLLQEAGYVTGDDELELTARGHPSRRTEGPAGGLRPPEEGPHGQPPSGYQGRGRRPVGRDQALRVRRSLPARSASHRQKRHPAGWLASAGVNEPQGLRDLPQTNT